MGDAGPMDDVVDLDLAAAEVQRRAEGWRQAGISVGDITWRDQAEGWPWSLKTDRTEVRDPDSIGVMLRKGRQEGEVVLFKGGWCDFGYWTGDAGDDPLQDAPGYPDEMTVEGFGVVLDRVAELFR